MHAVDCIFPEIGLDRDWDLPLEDLPSSVDSGSPSSGPASHPTKPPTLAAMLLVEQERYAQLRHPSAPSGAADGTPAMTPTLRPPTYSGIIALGAVAEDEVEASLEWDQRAEKAG
jgi:hypothetical protein